MFGIRRKAGDYYGRIKSIPAKATQQVEVTIEATKVFVYKSIVAFLTLSILAFLSIFMYGMFYFTFVPSPELEGQVFLNFQPCEKTPGRCGFLNGSLQLSPRNPVLMAGQPYTVSLLLEMPESPVNRKAGMFMTCSQMKTRESKIMKHSCKSAILQYRSELLRTIDTFVFLPGLLTGYTMEKQVVYLQLFDDFYDDPLSPAVQIDIQIQSRFVEIYTATYRIHANFGGLRYMMFYYPLTSAVIGSSLNMLLLSILFLLSWYRFFMSSEEDISVEEFAEFQDPFSENEDIGKEKKDIDKESSGTDEEREKNDKDNSNEQGRMKIEDLLDKEEEKAREALRDLKSEE